MLKKIFFTMVFICLTFWMRTSNALAEKFDFTELKKIPILHEGRIKPMDSLARGLLLTTYGHSQIGNAEAIEWLYELILAPERANMRPVFNIDDPAVAEALGLIKAEDHKYSFSELKQGFATTGNLVKEISNLKDKERTDTQKHILELREKVLIYQQISRGLVPFFPEFKIESLNLANLLGIKVNEPINFFELLQTSALGLEQFEESLRLSSTRFSKKERQEMADLILKLNRYRIDEKLEVFRVLPPNSKNENDPWQSPLGAAKTSVSEVNLNYLDLWRNLREVYLANNFKKFEQQSLLLVSHSERITAEFIPNWKIRMEVFYNSLNPFIKALTFYILAFILTLLSWIFKPKLMSKISLLSIFCAFGFHLVGLIIRVLITGRPPVTTLYESIIFVAFVVVLFALLFAYMGMRNISLLLGSTVGAILLFVSTRYSVTGDTMGVLIAVLDTNFWLATHVVCITIGYGACLVGGVLGHIYLILMISKFSSKKNNDQVARNIVGVSLVALFFCLLGTILGGIWADQSWGRFWGWDPKENGALVIVLWLLFLLHGNLTKMIGKLGYAIGMVITNIVVALAWFGVNLLSVGLHSYGFTSNIALNLGLFCGMELLFATFMFVWIQYNKNTIQNDATIQ